MSFIPKVSVLIPTYNYGHFLSEAIESVLKQTFNDFEIVIVDNNSTDNTNEVVKKYLQDKRIHFYQNENNIGLVNNWNKCIGYARGKYIKFLCADDKLHPNLLEKFVSVMEKHTNVSIVSSYNKSFGLSDTDRIPPFQGLVKGNVAKENLIGQTNWLYAPTANMYRRADLNLTNNFNPQLLLKVDLELYMRLLTIGDCYIVPEFLSYTRTHYQTISSTLSTKKYINIFERYKYMNLVKENSISANNSFNMLVSAEIKKRSIRCALVMYEMLPKLFKKENRKLLIDAFWIGYNESVLFEPIRYYLKWKFFARLLKNKKKNTQYSRVKLYNFYSFY